MPVSFPRPNPTDVTAYQRIADSLRQRLLAGRWGPEEQLPTEQELCRQFGTSQITVRRAMQIIEEEHLVERRQGRGTFATPAAQRKIPILNSDFFGSTCRHAPRLERSLHSCEWAKIDSELAATLRACAGDPVLKAVRIDRLHGMSDTLIVNVRALEPGEGAIAAWVRFWDGKITAIGPADCAPGDVPHTIDGGGRLLTPGLIDVHTHGIELFAYEGGPEQLLAASRRLGRYGTTSVLPTFYDTMPRSDLKELERLAVAMSSVEDVFMPGMHMEGPFLKLTGAGAETVPGDVGLLDELLAAARGRVAAMSISPEVSKVIPVIERPFGRLLRRKVGKAFCWRPIQTSAPDFRPACTPRRSAARSRLHPAMPRGCGGPVHGSTARWPAVR